MRAIRIHKTGGPEVLQLDEVDTPRARAGAGARPQPRDRRQLSRHLSPHRPLSDAAAAHPRLRRRGRSDGAWPRRRRLQGRRPRRLCDDARLLRGRAQRRRKASRRRCPRASRYEPAAAMMLKGLTAQYLLRQTYRVQPGDTILVHAAAGGVGQILCQWGKHLGATVHRNRRLRGQGQDRQSLRRRSRHQLLAGGFRRAGRRDHQGREMRRRLRRRRQDDVPRLARLPAAVRRLRELRLRVRARSRRSISASSARRARCSPRGRRCSPSSPTARVSRPWPRSCSRSSRSGVVKVEISEKRAARRGGAGATRSRRPAHHRLRSC